MSHIELTMKVSRIMNDCFGNIPLEQRKKLLAFTLGRVLGLHATLPSSAVPSCSAYFSRYHLSNIATTLSRVNEACNFDVDLAIETAKSFYILRYESVYSVERVADLAFHPIFTQGGQVAATITELCALDNTGGVEGSTRRYVAIRDLTNSLSEELINSISEYVADTGPEQTHPV